jgi:hypothetical protein
LLRTFFSVWNTSAQRFREFRRPEGSDHEFLQVDRIVGMRAAIDDVHHRDRQEVGGDAAQVAIERSTLRCCPCAGSGHGNGEDGIGSEAALVRCTVEGDHSAIDFGLLDGIFAVQGLGNLAVDVGDRLEGAFAEIAAFVAIPQFHGFVLSGGCAGRHCRSSHTSVDQINICFHGRIPARIENLSSNHFYNRRQRITPMNAVGKLPRRQPDKPWPLS